MNEQGTFQAITALIFCIITTISCYLFVPWGFRACQQPGHYVPTIKTQLHSIHNTTQLAKAFDHHATYTVCKDIEKEKLKVIKKHNFVI